MRTQTESIPMRNLVENLHFRIEPCARCPLPGYLIVSPRIRVSSLVDLPSNAQDTLGRTLAAATCAIQTVVRPRRVYCALFAEEAQSVHFHLFPRTEWLLASYSRVHPNDAGVSGPRLLDWARSTFHEPVAGDYGETTGAIFRLLHQIF